MRSVLASMAEWERDVIRDRTRSGIVKRVQQGGWGGGNLAPYGYRVVGQGSQAHLEIDEREAAMLRKAVDLILDQGLTSGETARTLNALGLTPRNAALWTSQNLRNMLVRGQFDGVWTFAKAARRVRWHEPVTVQVPPVIAADRMASLRARLAATSISRGQHGVHPLSGRLVCLCGAAMTGLARSDRAVRRYRCRFGRHEPGRPFCPQPSLRAELVDGAVWAEVLRLLTDPAALSKAAAKYLATLPDGGFDPDDVEAATVAVERAQGALADAVARGLRLGLDDSTLARTVAELQHQYDAAARHLAAIQAAQQSSRKQVDRLAQIAQLAGSAHARLQTAPPELQAEVFALLDVRVTVLEHGEPVRLRVDGTVAGDLLGGAVRPEPTPTNGASACA